MKNKVSLIYIFKFPSRTLAYKIFIFRLFLFPPFIIVIVIVSLKYPLKKKLIRAKFIEGFNLEIYRV